MADERVTTVLREAAERALHAFVESCKAGGITEPCMHGEGADHAHLPGGVLILPFVREAEDVILNVGAFGVGGEIAGAVVADAYAKTKLVGVAYEPMDQSVDEKKVH